MFDDVSSCLSINAAGGMIKAEFCVAFHVGSSDLSRGPVGSS